MYYFKIIFYPNLNRFRTMSNTRMITTILIALLLISCKRQHMSTFFSPANDDKPALSDSDFTESSSETDINNTTEPIVIKHKYSFGTDTSKHWQRTITLPATGKFVQESHYVTTNDEFPGNRLFAKTQDENITLHLKNSLHIYQSYDSTMTYERLYNNKHKKVWTPAERGNIGQGSVGNIQTDELTPEMELWMMCMMWAPGEKTERGTKFILSANGKKVVAVAGYETGPGQKKYLGGVTCEIHAWLGTTSSSDITVEYAEDQSLVCGPLNCP